MDITTVDAFASHIFCSYLSDDFSRLAEQKQELEYVAIKQEGQAHSAGTSCQTILDQFQDEKSALLKAFNEVNNQKLKYTNTEFKISTSWISKTPSGGFSNFHNHGNSFMSGILYFDEYDDASGPLELAAFNFPTNSFQLVPSEFNEYNSKDYTIYPSKNLLILFPSYIYHRIGTNNSIQNRYSLAFNIVPSGTVGIHDSTLQLP